MRGVVHVLGRSQGGIRRHVRYLAVHPPSGWRTECVVGPPALAPYFRDVPFRDAGRLRRLRPGRSADLVHAHGLTAGAAAVVPGRPPVVLTLHMDIDTQGRTAAVPLLRSLAPAIASRADALIAVSERIARRFPRAHVIAPAADPPGPPRRTRDRVRAELGAASDDVVVLCVARLHPDKGLETFVRAVRGARCVGWVAGDGPLRGTLLRLAEGSGVRLLGYREDVADLLGAADLFALPSVGEGYGIAVSEAVGAGLPVVATRSGAVPEIVGDAGLLVDPGDAAGFAGAVYAAATDETLRQRLAEAARRRRLPSPDELVAAVGRVYDEVAG